MSGDREQRIVRYLAGLATDPRPVLNVASAGVPATVSPAPAFLFGVDAPPVRKFSVEEGRLEELIARDRLQPTERLLRLGWGWVAGRTKIEGETRRVMLPLVSIPIRPTSDSLRQPFHHRFRAAGDVTPSHLITDHADQEAIADGLVFPHHLADERVEAWMLQAVSAMGLRARYARTITLGHAAALDDLAVVPVAAAYLARDAVPVGSGAALSAWAPRLADAPETSFGLVYRSTRSSLPPLPLVGAPESVDVSTLPLDPVDPPAATIVPVDPDQEQAILRARDEEVSVILGPPGTGKSHTVAAVAVDAVARGQSVLIATRSHHAASVLIDFVREAGAPRPIVFGDSQSRDELAQELWDRLSGVPDTFGRQRSEALHDAQRAWEVRRDQVHEALEAESYLAGGDLVATVLSEREVDIDLEEASLRFSLIESAGTGWFARWRANRWLDKAARDEGRPSLRRRVAAYRLRERGGLTLGPLLDDLLALDRERRVRFAAELRGRYSPRVPEQRAALLDLSRGLRASRTRRRRILLDLDVEPLLDAAPLWIGTIGDIEDILPPTPGIFDLVIIDEASQVDQMQAPPALLRAKRVVAVGDASQLRHVSFTADLAVDAGLREHDLVDDPVAGLLDVRRNSLLDVAALAGTVTQLTTHYRGAPHLIEFSSERFYRGRVQPATHHPALDTRDCIEVVEVDGVRTDEGNIAEADAVIDRVHALIDGGYDGSIGVVTPIRAQADLIQRRLIEALRATEIERHELAAGTVHEFQGAQRDHVIVSTVIDDESPGGSVAFVEDDNLFNVMVTRAKDDITFFTSQRHPKRGLVTAYIAHASSPSEPPSERDSRGAWTRRVGDYLADQGLTVRFGYPVGHEVVDLVVGDGEDAVALECEVHPDGPEAHIRRRALLVSMGWRIVDAFESRWGDDLAEFAIRFGNGDLLAEG